ncbi:MAG: pyridoxal-phosphate dependent enzyme [Pseudoxanthomonas sp.]
MATPASVLQLIGNTPLLKAQRLDTGVCELYLKLESANPGGSIKDRVALFMIEAAERRGDIRPGDTLVDAAAGNLGASLALVAGQKGYRLILVVPDRIGREKISNLKAMGADVVPARSGAGEQAAKLAAETPRAHFLDHAGNPDHPATHETGTGPEILRQLDGRVDAVVLGCGSGGTLAGLSRAFARHAPQVELILADPAGSALASHVNGGNADAATTVARLVTGIGAEQPPPLADFSRVKQAISVTDAESFHAARELLEKEGILGGASTGTLLAAALRYCRQQTAPRRVVVLVPDGGRRHLSKLYDDDWMRDNGFIERPRHGDLRDLIPRPYSQRDTVVVAPGDTLNTAYQRMQLHDVSQLPVMEGEKLVGIVDESDVLLHVYGDETCFADPVSIAMVGKLDRLDVKSPIEALLPVFDRGQVAIVTDGDAFLGLITRIDLLNYLRRRV